MPTSCVFRYTSRIMCLGIALDNGINTLYYLNLDNWPLISTIAITIACIFLNGLLYYDGANSALSDTWDDFKSLNHRSIVPYIISLTSAYVMAAFTLHNYREGVIQIPIILTYIFTACYFIGTHTLIIQATKRNLKNDFFELNNKQKIVFIIWFIILMLATATAIPQWTAGIDWLWQNASFTTFTAWVTYTGEAFFVAQLALWLSMQKLHTYNKSILTCVIFAATLNALGFACMTEFDSWITNSLNNNTTFALGFTLSFFMMFKSLCTWKADAKVNKTLIQLAHHQA